MNTINLYKRLDAEQKQKCCNSTMKIDKTVISNKTTLFSNRQAWKDKKDEPKREAK